mmetsp:Transcript_41159/g.81154  ORF Transcript_41159/g.81154 Transcript_41159/m.81154 type:complete len:261 (+) Transcript_41159:665-1447(+)
MDSVATGARRRLVTRDGTTTPRTAATTTAATTVTTVAAAIATPRSGATSSLRNRRQRANRDFHCLALEHQRFVNLHRRGRIIKTRNSKSALILKRHNRPLGNQIRTKYAHGRTKRAIACQGGRLQKQLRLPHFGFIRLELDQAPCGGERVVDELERLRIPQRQITLAARAFTGSGLSRQLLLANVNKLQLLLLHPLFPKQKLHSLQRSWCTRILSTSPRKSRKKSGFRLCGIHGGLLQILHHPCVAKSAQESVCEVGIGA